MGRLIFSSRLLPLVGPGARDGTGCRSSRALNLRLGCQRSSVGLRQVAGGVCGAVFPDGAIAQPGSVPSIAYTAHLRWRRVDCGGRVDRGFLEALRQKDRARRKRDSAWQSVACIPISGTRNAMEIMIRSL